MPNLTFAILLLAAATAAPTIAHAGDSTTLVCSPKDGSGGVFVHFYEHRGADGDSRDEAVSTIYQGKLFQAKHVNKNDADGAKIAVKLGTGKHVRFDGTYTKHLDGAGPYSIDLVGKVNDDPSAGKAVWRKLEVTLTCADLSN